MELNTTKTLKYTSSNFLYLIPKNIFGQIPYVDLWHCLNSAKFSCRISITLTTIDAVQKCYCVSLRGLIYQQLFSWESPKMEVNKGQAKNKHFTVFFESIPQENQLIIKRSLCNYCYGTGAWKKLALSSYFSHFSWGKPGCVF